MEVGSAILACTCNVDVDLEGRCAAFPVNNLSYIGPSVSLMTLRTRSRNFLQLLTFFSEALWMSSVDVPGVVALNSFIFGSVVEKPQWQRTVQLIYNRPHDVLGDPTNGELGVASFISHTMRTLRTKEAMTVRKAEIGAGCCRCIALSSLCSSHKRSIRS